MISVEFFKRTRKAEESAKERRVEFENRRIVITPTCIQISLSHSLLPTPHSPHDMV